MPFPAERVMKVSIYFVIHQLDRKSGSRVFCPTTAVMGVQPCIQICCPAAVETVIVAAKEIYIVHEAITIFLGYWLFG